MRISVGDLDSWAVLAAGLGLWLLVHPYQGIWHDARLYTVAALHWLDPAAYARDPWFMFGSQDDWTLFSPLYAGLVRLFDIGRAAQYAVLAGALAWMSACWTLCRSLLDRPWAIAATLVLPLLALGYSISGASVFFVTENFVSARIFAIPLTVFGIAAIHRNRPVQCASFLLLALVIHPLMAVGGIAVAVAARCRDQQLLLLLVCAIVLLALAAANPMNWVALRTIDSGWFALLQASGTSALLDARTFHLKFLLGPVAILLWGAAFAPATSARLYRIVCLVAVWSVFASLVVCNYQPATLLVQVQLWRMAWLAVLFAVPAAFEIMVAGLGWGQLGRLTLVSGTLLLYLIDAWNATVALCAWLVWDLRKAQILSLVDAYRTWLTRAMVILTVGLSLLSVPSVVLDMVGLGMSAPGLSLSSDRLYFLKAIGLYFALPAMLWFSIAARRKLMLVLPVLLLPLAGYGWDQRTELLRLTEAHYRSGGDGLFRDHIRHGDTVYWANNTLRTWFELGAASYASEVQVVGLVYSQPRTKELQRRMTRIWMRDKSPGINGATPSLPSHRNLHAYESAGEMTSWGLKNLCADPQLDWVVDHAEVGTRFVYQVVDPVRGHVPEALFLYDCRNLRND